MKKISYLNLPKIKAAVEKYYDIKDIGIKYRGKPLLKAREHYCKISKHFTDANLTQIGSLINRDHATVLNCLENYDNFVKIERIYKDDYDSLVSVLSEEMEMIAFEAEDLRKEERIIFLQSRKEAIEKELDFLTSNN